MSCMMPGGHPPPRRGISIVSSPHTWPPDAACRSAPGTHPHPLHRGLGERGGDDRQLSLDPPQGTRKAREESQPEASAPRMQTESGDPSQRHCPDTSCPPRVPVPRRGAHSEHACLRRSCLYVCTPSPVLPRSLTNHLCWRRHLTLGPGSAAQSRAHTRLQTPGPCLHPLLHPDAWGRARPLGRLPRGRSPLLLPSPHQHWGHQHGRKPT